MPRMTVTSRLVLAVLVASAGVTSWCSASDSTGYLHIGCYYEVHKCGSPPYYIENHQPNTSLFDVCSNFTNTRGWKSFGIQTLQKTDCITGAHFHKALNPFCFKPGNCSNDRGNVTRYSYDVFVKGNISVFEPPSFIEKPNSQTVTEGKNVQFICNATGSPFPSILWYKDEKELPGNSSKYQMSNGNTTLTINNTGKTDQGSYSCNVSNSVGPGLSWSANLIVNYPPRIFIGPSNTTSVENDNVSLTCYLEGKPLSNVTWIKDGTLIISANDNRISVSPPTSVSNTSATITITNVNRTDEGSYSCQAVNDVGSGTSSPALLTVNYGVRVFVNPQPMSRTEGESVTLTCEVEGKPAPNVVWFKNGNPLTVWTSRMYDTQPTTHHRTAVSLTINDLKRTDEGNYSCNVKNSCGEQNSTASLLTVNQPSKILLPPTSQTVVERNKVSLTCYLEGKPVSTVTWIKDGTQIIPANDNRISVSSPTSVSNASATITIANVTRTDEGSYSCQAVNDVGKDTSSAALLTVNFAPKILVPPTSQTVAERSKVSLTCYLEGKPVSTVTWLKDDTPIIPANDNRISVSPPTSVSNASATITITNVTRTDEGSYSCQAVNDVGNDTSSAALLTVNFAPKILVPPTSQTVAERSKVSLTCYLEGKPVSTVTWIKDDTPIIPANDNRISVSSPTSVSNASATITITNVTRTDEGSYSCQAVNNVGSDTSSEALLTVNYPQRILVPPTSQTVAERSKVSLTCYLEGKPVSTVTWIKDGTPIIPANDNRISVSPPTSVSNTSATITITNATRTDEGSYSCVAVNDVGNDTSSAALLTVNFAPKILVPPTRRTVAERNSVTLTCYLEGKPLSNVTWIKSDTPIIPANDNRISVSPPTSVSNTSATITITNATRTDEGYYSCQSVNDVGKDTSSGALLTVNFAPKILVPPTSQTVAERSKVSLTCYLEGKPVSTVTWIKDGTPIIPANDNRISVSPPTSVSNTSATITITYATRTDEGSYSCQAVNNVGSDTSSEALLTVNYPPRILVPPTSQTVVETSNVSLTCYLEGKPVSTVTWIKDGTPIIPANDNRISVSQPTSVSNASATITITNVTRTDEGSYSCQAVNDVGNDTSSAALLTVNYPPRIFIGPSNTTSVKKDNVSLTCYLEGKPLSNVTWIKDDTPIIPANDNSISVMQPTSVRNGSTSITLTNVNHSDEGRYCCQAKQQSRCSFLVVNYGIRIFVGPKAKTKKENDSVSMTCEVEGKPVPEITWLKNNKSLPMDNKRMRTNQSKSHSRILATITIKNLSRTDEGRYSCTANNSLDEQVSDPSRLTVNYPPKIFSHSKSRVNKMELHSVTLSCEVEGKPISQVTWFKDNIQITSNHRIIITQPNTAKRTNVDLQINHLASDDQGGYQCSVENVLGSKTSNSSYLTVNYKPRITKQLTNETVFEGKNVSFVCHYEGHPKPKVKWLKDNIEIKPEEPRLSISGDTMTIKKARKNDEGRYECRVENDFGHNISSGILVVKYDGSFAVRPRNETYIEGQKVILTCNRDDMSKAKVHWMINGARVKSQNGQGSVINIAQDGTQLTITKLKRTDQGSYYCEAVSSNSSYRHLSLYGYVNVNYKPKVLQPPSRSTKNENESVTLTCKFEGKPFPSVTWLKNGQKLDTNTSDRISSTVSQREQAEYVGTAKLQISKLRREDQGSFSCFIENRVNSTFSEEGFLEIRYPPVIFSSPRNITKNESDQIQLSCTMEGYPKPSVSWQKDGSIIDESQEITFETKGNASLWESTLTIKSVKHTDAGSYSCVTKNTATEKAIGSQAANLVVNYLHDVFVSTPNPYILNLGQKSASLQCSAVGFPKPVLSWYKDGNVIPRREDGKISLTAPKNGVNYSEAGNYTCVAYSRTLNKTTRGTVEVLFKPEIQHKPTDQTTVQGTLVSFYCNATGVPEPVISWRFSGSSTLKHTGEKNVIGNVTNTKKYEGRYTCIASSRAGRTEESASLNVLVPPTRQAALRPGTILQLGQTLRITCDVYGDPEPSFEWTKRLREEAEGLILPNQKKIDLVIQDVRVKDAAFYGCTATNTVGKITLKDAFIDVNTSLNIINGGHTFIATEESSTIIKCIASSKIQIDEVKLFKDDIELKTQMNVSDDNEVVTAEIEFTKVSTDDSGKYRCVAKNRQKEVRAEVTLIVNVPIKVEMDVSLKNKTFTEELRDNSSQEYKNLTVEFIREMKKVYINESGFVRIEVLGFSNGSVSVRFRVVYKIKVESPEEKPPPDTKVHIANVLVRKVKKSDGIVGNLILKAESLKPKVKPPAPRNLTAIDIMKTSITVQWSPPLFHDVYSVENYVVMSKEFSSSWKKLEVGGQHVDTLLLENMEPGTSYSIKARAVNHVGEGLPCKMIEVKTLSDFWNTFTKIFVPLIVLLMIGVIVLLFLKRRRTRSKAKLMIDLEVEGKRCEYDEFHDGAKHLKCGGGDALEMVELPMRCKSIPRENIELGKELGSGQFGVVYKGFLKEKGEENDVPCAVKMLKPGASESDYRDLFNELEIMCSVEEHPNIVNLLGACIGGDGPLYVVVEFAENGCLLDYLRENRIIAVDEDGNKEEVSSLGNQEKIGLALDIARGMEHLASHKCVHRDLAARNVLLGKDRIAKVADFGLARDVYEQGFYEKSSGGKLPAKWMSIEALETLKATSASDVWSFGVLLWEIEAGGKMPYAGLSYVDLVKALKSGVRLQKPTNCTDELYSIMKDCWEVNPEKRPKFEVLSLVLDNLLMAFLED